MSGRPAPVALVTGASMGIGRAIAEQLARDGFEVIGASRNASADEPSLLGVRMATLDVTSDQSVRDCVSGLLARAGRIDVLVNNAGYLASGAVEEVPMDQAKAQFETNFFGAVRMIQAVLPTMRGQGGGLIVNITSLAGLVPLPFWGFYDASKFALEGLTEALREELRPFGIRVCAVEPGSIRTGFWAADRKAPSMKEYAARRVRFEKSMRQGEEKAPGPEAVALKVARIVRSPHPALLNPVTTEATVVPLLRRWLPRAWFERALRSNFHLDDEGF
ncbi:MAG TPA: SDR family NAD(P)-dependent oxidoreductase [Vicinamibacteria bacterium]